VREGRLSAAKVARSFLSVVWDSEAPTLELLSRALDQLLLQSHDVPFDDCDERDSAPPRSDWKALYDALAVRFPDLGFYAVADPLAPVESERMLGDAIDDLADITSDLREVIWRDENISASDAAWFFRLLFPHWGGHARELSLYLHAKWSEAEL
jgi:hypothetical protein